MKPPKLRISFDAWGTFTAAAIAVVALHFYRPLDFSEKPILGVLYWTTWGLFAACWGRFFCRLSQARVTSSGAAFPSLAGDISLLWSEVTQVQVLERGGIVLLTSTGRIAFPLLFLADKDRVLQFVVGKARCAGAVIVGIAGKPNKPVQTDRAPRGG